MNFPTYKSLPYTILGHGLKRNMASSTMISALPFYTAEVAAMTSMLPPYSASSLLIRNDHSQDKDGAQ
jgi:hypothetical protein